MKKYLACLALIASVSLGCNDSLVEELDNEQSLANLQNAEDSELPQAVSVYAGQSDFLRNFSLNGDERKELGERTAFDSI